MSSLWHKVFKKWKQHFVVLIEKKRKKIQVDMLFQGLCLSHWEISYKEALPFPFSPR